MNLQPGDLFACWGAGRVEKWISRGTASLFGPAELRLGPSHVAIACEDPRTGLPLWIESTTYCRHPCVINHFHARGCQAHWPSLRLADYAEQGGRVEVYRLSPIQSLSHEESGLLSDIVCKHFVEKQIRYDLGGALLSGTRVFKWTRLLPPAHLGSVFCSELVAAVLMRLGRLNHENPTRFNPASLLRRLVNTGVYQRVAQPVLKIAEGTADAAA